MIIQKFGADMKFIEECYGLQCANASYGCIYCEVDLSKPWENGDEKLKFPINRTLSRADAIVKNDLNKKKISKHDKKGYLYKPLLHIEFKMIVIDTLHLFLRISDKLLITLIQIINENDDDSSCKNFEKRKNLKKFMDILENEVKITKPYYFSDLELEKIKLRSFNGTEREKIFNYFSNTFSLEQLFPSINRMKKFNLVFIGFWALFCKIKNYKNPLSKENFLQISMDANMSEIDVSNLSKLNEFDLGKLDIELRAWLYSYMPFSHTLDSTLSPYLHIFVYHSKELLELHGNINLYNTQGLEKLNSTQTSTYFRSTNKKTCGSSTYIKQLVDNKNRNDFKNLDGILADLDS